jgi:hypothetical protein
MTRHARSNAEDALVSHPLAGVRAKVDRAEEQMAAVEVEWSSSGAHARQVAPANDGCLTRKPPRYPQLEPMLALHRKLPPNAFSRQTDWTADVILLPRA